VTFGVQANKRARLFTQLPLSYCIHRANMLHSHVTRPLTARVVVVVPRVTGGWLGGISWKTTDNDADALTQRRFLASLAHRRMLAKQNSQSKGKVTPSPEIVDAMPLSYREMDNSTLVTLAALENHEATIEVLIRHIMQIDKVGYEAATETMSEIRKVNNARRYYRTGPIKLGIFTALTAGFVSIPLVFHLPTVQWFNEHFVTADVPPAKDLETFLEVGSWSWNWMEPPLGQISFFILCWQMAS